MKKILVVGLLVSSAFFAPAQANEKNGNNECNQFGRSQGCLPGSGQNRQPPVVAQPQPNPPGAVQNPPQYNNGYGNGYGRRYGDGYRYRGDWNPNRNPGGLYFNFQTDPYYYDDPYYYNDPYPPRYNYYPRTRVKKCSQIASSLRNSGYRNVRSIDCVGRNYVYTASRGGEKLRLTVKISNGRILSIRRAN